MTDDTITRAELAAALREHLRSHREGLVVLGSPESAAEDLFGIACRNREPEYEPGAIYEDQEGNRYLRRPGRPLLAWARIFLDGAVQERHEDAPIRPLRKLVPEGTPAAVLDHGTVLNVIAGFGRLTYHEADALAGRICKLAGGECP